QPGDVRRGTLCNRERLEAGWQPFFQFVDHQREFSAASPGFATYCAIDPQPGNHYRRSTRDLNLVIYERELGEREWGRQFWPVRFYYGHSFNFHHLYSDCQRTGRYGQYLGNWDLS